MSGKKFNLQKVLDQLSEKGLFDSFKFEPDIRPKKLHFLNEHLIDGGGPYYQLDDFIIEPVRFTPKNFHLYHGTSLQALDEILESGTISTGGNLLRDDKLIWGELLKEIGESGNSKFSGPKFLRPDALEKLGVTLTEQDKKIFGHAYAVFFSEQISPSLAYTPGNRDEKAILGVNRDALNDRGYSFVDCGGEGIKCEGNIKIDFGLQVLLVPDSRVDEYRERVKGKYVVSIYPLSDLEK